MQVRPEQLKRQLQQGLSGSYLLSGDEPLLIQECADAVRAAARAGGCSEREIIEIGNDGKGWQALLQSAGMMSLFAERKLIEVRLPSGKPGTEGSKALQEYLGLDSEDVLLIVSGKIDSQSQRSKWYSALDQAGVTVTVWPVTAQEMPRWLGQRLSDAGLRADRDAVSLLAERVEGNLLAAVQEIEKLKLLAEDNRVTTDTVLASVVDSARYNPFGLADAALSGDARAAVRTLRGLEAEATPLPVVLWAIVRDLQLLSRLDEDRNQGLPIAQALQKQRVWKKRMGLVQAAIGRHSTESIATLHALAFDADATLKGFKKGLPFDVLEQLVVTLALGQSSSSRARRP